MLTEAFTDPSQGYGRRSLSCGNSATGSARWSTRSFLHNCLQLETFVFLTRRLLDGSENKTPFLDIIRCAHLEDAREKENARSHNRQKSKENGGCYAAKGVQSGIVPRYPRLRFSRST